ncbi:maleylpyruvate isomerase family mycothiol-dependent enzyme [Nocardia sp. R16R-3T]
MSENPVQVFVAAADSFATLVRSIPESRWDGPGLGEWDLRSLVGHTARALVTVTQYIQQPATVEDVASAHEYYARAKAAQGANAAAILERGRAAGAELGEKPADAVDALVAAASEAVTDSEDQLITVISGLGMRLNTYLTTRTFELVVHGLDIASATGIPHTMPDYVLEDAAVLAARIAVRVGEGEPVLTALTGRAVLSPSFSVV